MRISTEKKKRWAMRAMTLAVLGLWLCAGAGAQSTGKPAQGPAVQLHDVTDEIGRTVKLPAAPQRIISLAPSITETIYALGLQDHLVGDTDFCDYPADAQKKPRVGGAINPSLEVIASLHPDVVLVKRDFNRLETVRALESLGIQTYVLDPQTVEQIVTSTQRLGEVLGDAEAGKALAADLQQRLDTLQAKLSATPPSRVLFVVWTDPLISVGKETFVADALKRAGAQSIVDSTQSWPHMNLEEVVKLQPEYLVFAPEHAESAAKDIEALSNLPGWRMLTAVHDRHYAVVSEAVIRPAPRIVDAIEGLAHQLHPAAFQDAGTPAKETPAQVPASTTRPNAVHSEACRESSCDL